MGRVYDFNNTGYTLLNLELPKIEGYNSSHIENIVNVGFTSICGGAIGTEEYKIVEEDNLCISSYLKPFTAILSLQCDEIVIREYIQALNNSTIGLSSTKLQIHIVKTDINMEILSASIVTVSSGINIESISKSNIGLIVKLSFVADERCEPYMIETSKLIIENKKKNMKEVTQ